MTQSTSNAKDYKQQHLKFSGSWKEPKLAAYGCAYLKSDDVTSVRSGLQAAIACLFGPAGVVLRGGTPEEVKKAMDQSRSTFEHQMMQTCLLMDDPFFPVSSSRSSVSQMPKAVDEATAPSEVLDDDVIPMD